VKDKREHRMRHGSREYMASVVSSLLFVCVASGTFAAEEKRARTDSSVKPWYVLARAAASICGPFTSNLNASSQLEFDACQSRLSDKHSRFSRPHWEEIPFDLEVAEKIVKRAWAVKFPAKAEALWKEWLDDTQSVRNSGAAKMWRLQADLDGDGGLETIVRMNYALRFRKEMRRTESERLRRIEGCEYVDSALYMTAGDVELAKHFNANEFLHDLLHDGASNRYFAIEWSASPIAGVGIWDRGHPTVVAGATRGVAIYEINPRWGPRAVCNIQWIPGDRPVPSMPVRK